MKKTFRPLGIVGFVIAATAITMIACNSPTNDRPPVTEPTFGIILSVTGTYVFPSRGEGYETGDITALEVTVTNTGNQPTGALTVGLTGDSEAFALDTVSIPSIAVGTTARFLVSPEEGLPADTFEAAVTVSGSSVTARTFNVTFVVNNLIDLSKPEIESVADGIVYWAHTAGAGQVSAFLVFANGTPVSANLAAAVREFDLMNAASPELEIGNIYQITVKAVGVVDVSNSSPESDQREFVLPLPAPVITLEAGVVSWTAWNENLPVFGFRVYAGEEAVSGGQTGANARSFDLTATDIAVGVHQISVLALGLHEDDNDPRLNSGQSNTREFVRILPTPVIRINQATGEVSWDAIPEATGGFDIYVNSMHRETADAGSTSIVPRDLEDDDQIKVRAIHAANSDLNSDLSNTVIFGIDFEVVPLVLSGQVWTLDLATYEVVAEFAPGAEIVILGRGGAGTISASGLLNFTIEVPSDLGDIDDYFYGFSATPQGVRGASLEMYAQNPEGYIGKFGDIVISETEEAFWSVLHIFVTQAVEITGDGFEPISLEEGWNTVYQWSRLDKEAESDETVFSLTTPEGVDMKWIWLEDSHSCHCGEDICECGEDYCCGGNDCDCANGNQDSCGCGNEA